MLERTLAAEGYDVTAAPDGGEALAAIERSVPDLLVLDVGLPDLDGFAVWTLNSGGILPLALGIPAVLALLAGGARFQRRRQMAD